MNHARIYQLACRIRPILACLAFSLSAGAAPEPSLELWHKAVYADVVQQQPAEALPLYQALLARDDLTPPLRIAITGRLAKALVAGGHQQVALDLLTESLQTVAAAPDLHDPLLTSRADSVEHAAMQASLEHLIVAEIDWQAVPVTDAIAELRQVLRGASPHGPVINLIERTARDPQAAQPRVQLQLRNVPAGEVIRYLCLAADWHYKVEAYGVLLSPLSIPLEHLETRPLGVEFSRYRRDRIVPEKEEARVRDALQRMGVPFPDGSDVWLSVGQDRFIMRNPPAAHQLAQDILFIDPSQVRLTVEVDGRLYAVPGESGYTLLMSDESVVLRVTPTVGILAKSVDLELSVELGDSSLETRFVQPVGEPVTLQLNQQQVVIEAAVMPLDAIPSSKQLELAENMGPRQCLTACFRLAQAAHAAGDQATTSDRLNDLAEWLQDQAAAVETLLDLWPMQAAVAPALETRLTHTIIDRVQFQEMPIDEALRAIVAHAKGADLVLLATTDHAPPSIALDLQGISVLHAMKEACAQASWQLDVQPHAIVASSPFRPPSTVATVTLELPTDWRERIGQAVAEESDEDLLKRFFASCGFQFPENTGFTLHAGHCILVHAPKTLAELVRVWEQVFAPPAPTHVQVELKALQLIDQAQATPPQSPAEVAELSPDQFQLIDQAVVISEHDQTFTIERQHAGRTHSYSLKAYIHGDTIDIEVEATFPGELFTGFSMPDGGTKVLVLNDYLMIVSAKTLSPGDKDDESLRHTPRGD